MLVIRPAVPGVEHVLAAVARAGGVQRMMVASSVVAVAVWRAPALRPLGASALCRKWSW